MPRLLLLPLFAALAIAATSARGDDAASAKQVFDSLYGPRLKQVAGTIDRGDDLTLAKDMLGVAKTSTSTPALLALLCESAHDLGMKHADGYATAAEAMSLLADTVAEKRAAARDKLVAVLTKQSTAGKPDERDAAGEKLIDTLLAMGDEKMEAKKWSEAASDYRKALATASMRKSAKLDQVKGKLEESMRRDRVEKQIARLQEKILKDATDAASAEELVKLLVVEMDDPAAAIAFLNRTMDKELKQFVPLAATPLAQLNEDQCLALGEWYRKLAKPGVTNQTPLERASRYLTRYLETHSATDLTGKKAHLMLEEIRLSLKKPEPIATKSTEAEEKWISKGATYKISSNNATHSPLPSLLTDNDNLHTGAFAFHTAEGLPGQNCVIDLGERMTITRIWIEHRRDNTERAAGMTVWLSNKAGDKGEKIWFTKEGGKEWTIKVPKAKARYITIGLPETVREPLHLAKVKVYGLEK